MVKVPVRVVAVFAVKLKRTRLFPVPLLPVSVNHDALLLAVQAPDAVNSTWSLPAEGPSTSAAVPSEAGASRGSSGSNQGRNHRSDRVRRFSGVLQIDLRRQVKEWKELQIERNIGSAFPLLCDPQGGREKASSSFWAIEVTLNARQGGVHGKTALVGSFVTRWGSELLHRLRT
jgi:hypothetical protein